MFTITSKIQFSGHLVNSASSSLPNQTKTCHFVRTPKQKLFFLLFGIFETKLRCRQNLIFFPNFNLVVWEDFMKYIEKRVNINNHEEFKFKHSSIHDSEHFYLCASIIDDIFLYLSSSFWWWLLHWVCDLLSMHIDIFLKIFSPLLKFSFSKRLMFSFTKSTYLFFSNTVQCLLIFLFPED